MSVKSVLAALSAAVQNKTGVAGPLTLAEMTDAVNDLKLGADITVEHGYINTDGMYQAMDLTGSSPVDKGEPEAVDELTIVRSCMIEPEYGALTLYECAAVVPPAAGAALEDHVITLLQMDEADPACCGIYHLADSAAADVDKVYQKNGLQHKLRVKVSETDPTMGNIVLCDSGESVLFSTPTMALDNIWTNWFDEFWGVVYGTNPDEDYEYGNMPSFYAYKARYGVRDSYYGVAEIIRLADCGETALNGTYAMCGNTIELVAADCGFAWINEEGNVLVSHSEFAADVDADDDGMAHSIYINKHGSSHTCYFYMQMTKDGVDTPAPFSESDFNSYSWVTGPCGLVPAPVFSAAAAPVGEASAGSWSGRLLIQNKDTAAWETSATLFENMPISGVTPEVGKVYSQDTTLQVTIAGGLE